MRTVRHLGAAVAIALTFLAVTTPAAAEESSPRPSQSEARAEPNSDATDANEDLFAQIQLGAVEAMMEGDWPTAEQRARAALAIDGGPRASQARLVLIRALEQRGAVVEALSELDVLLGLKLLPQHRSKGEEIKQRLTARAPQPTLEESATTGPVGPVSAKTRKATGIGLVAAGAAPLVVGTMFVSWDIGFAAQDVESGTWALIGTPLLVTGIAAEIIGVALLVPKKTKPAAVSLVPTFGVAPETGASSVRFSAGMVGRW